MNGIQKLVPMLFAASAAILVEVWIGKPAFAHECTSKEIDANDPKATIQDVVDDNMQFRWIADVDVWNGQSYTCNCVINLSPNGWAGSWEKAGVEVPLTRPLGPKTPEACKGSSIWVHREKPDLDAPIIYGTADHVAQALVYVSEDKNSQTKRQDNWSYTFRASFLNTDGEPTPLSVDIFFVDKGEGYVFEASVSPGVVALMTGDLKTFLIPEIFLKGQNMSFISDVDQWIDTGTLGPSEITDKSAIAFSDSSYAFLPPNIYDTTEEGIFALTFFDKERKLIFKSSISLPTVDRQ